MQNNANWIEADWPAPNHVHAGTTTRKNGISKGNFQSFNLADHVGDSLEAVKANRQKLQKDLSLPGIPFWLNQTHSNRIISLNNTKGNNTDADGSYTDRVNTVCAVLTADCVPVLLTDFGGTKVAAIHAGWKGICNGILDQVSDIFIETSEVLAWIGPSISVQHYEVGTDVYTKCFTYRPETKLSFYEKNSGKWQCDIAQMTEIILRLNNVKYIYQSKICCYEQSEYFYSYRRNKQTGRTASMIWME
ncbi:MAG: peptidoglycan editing factor PgeF [Pseudomonadota bacterium]